MWVPVIKQILIITVICGASANMGWYYQRLWRGKLNIISGRLDIARQVTSPNCNRRPNDEISLIVIHGISLPAGHFGSRYVEALFCNQLKGTEHGDFVELDELKVSSHLFIQRTGEVIQFVPFHLRAWHAGKSIYQGREECNDFSVGIELEGTENDEYADRQYKVLIDICHLMLATWFLGKEAIVGHSDIAPGRKKDPGAGFDWPRLRAGLTR